MYQSQNNLIHVAKTEDALPWHSATGPISVRLTNDYLFRALLQKNNKVLKGFISSLLNLSPDEIQSITIKNPIQLGKALDDKEFFLDIALKLNNDTFINLELQVINEKNWPERSLSYLCRTYDHLVSGEKYSFAKKALQIGILDFTLFPEHPEFYATYQFLNIKNHMVYSDKVQLSVLNLNRIDLATEEDIACGLDHWASLFKATTWEELKMLAKNDDLINEAAETIYQLTSDEHIRLQCEAREEYYRRQRTTQSIIDEQQEQLNQNAERLAEQDEQLAENAEQLAKNAEQLAENAERLAKQDEQLAAKDEEIAALKARLAQLDK